MAPLRILGFDIKDFKRIEVFQCRLDPEAGLVTIGGENANGKSSILDALYSALVGTKADITNPVRDEAETANIRVLIGSGQEVEYKVLRTFTRDGSPTIKVVSEAGGSVQNPTKFLRDLLGANCVDPVAFLAKDPREQRTTLAKLVGLDLSGYDAQIAAAREEAKRREEHQNRLVARVEQMPWHEDAPAEPVSYEWLTAEMQAANDANVARERKAVEVQAARMALENVRTKKTQVQSERERVRDEIARLQERMLALADDVDRLDAETTNLGERILAEEQALEAMPIIDTAPIAAAMREVEATNQKVRENQARINARQEWEAAERELGEALSAQRAAEAAKRRALAEAKFPVEGLGFDEAQITYHGQPFSQASLAERIRVATSIALAMGGRLRPIFIRDASTLDNQSLKIVEDLAEAAGAQVFAEVVANRTEDGFDRDCAFYVVEGRKHEEVAAR